MNIVVIANIQLKVPKCNTAIWHSCAMLKLRLTFAIDPHYDRNNNTDYKISRKSEALEPCLFELIVQMRKSASWIDKVLKHCYISHFKLELIPTGATINMYSKSIVYNIANH